MTAYRVQPVAGYFAIIRSATGEVFAEVLEREQAIRIVALLDGKAPAEELPRPLPSEQLTLFGDGLWVRGGRRRHDA